MWLFLATEILLFGGLFCAYAVYRANHPEVFAYAHQYLDATLGGINTLVLICSSLTMAWAVRCAQLGQRRTLTAMLALTLLCGFGFLGIKFVEYQHKWKHGLLWGRGFAPEGALGNASPHGSPAPGSSGGVSPAPGTGTVTPPAAPADRSAIAPAAEGPAGLASADPKHGGAGVSGARPDSVQLFFAVYFAMTGLHGLHVVAGLAVLGWLLRRSLRGDFGPACFAAVDLGGLYWHLIDVIWIFLFPLLYLIT